MRMKEYYDRRHTPKHFAVGDKVLLRLGNFWFVSHSPSAIMSTGTTVIRYSQGECHLSPPQTGEVSLKGLVYGY